MHTVKMNEVTFKTHYKLQRGNYQHQHATIKHSELRLRFDFGGRRPLSGSIQSVVCGFWLSRLRLIWPLLLIRPVF